MVHITVYLGTFIPKPIKIHTFAPRTPERSSLLGEIERPTWGMDEPSPVSDSYPQSSRPGGESPQQRILGISLPEAKFWCVCSRAIASDALMNTISWYVEIPHIFLVFC